MSSLIKAFLKLVTKTKRDDASRAIYSFGSSGARLPELNTPKDPMVDDVPDLRPTSALTAAAAPTATYSEHNTLKMAHFPADATISGDSNQGFQLGQNHGTVSISAPVPPGRQSCPSDA
jgi:hypothetical protein